MNVLGTCLKQIKKSELSIDNIKKILQDVYDINTTEDGQLIVKVGKKEDKTNIICKLKELLQSTLNDVDDSELCISILPVVSGIAIRMTRVNRR